MRTGIVVNVTREDCRRLEGVVSDRSALQKHVWRANIILATADGCGTAEMMRRTGKSKPVVWTWRFMAAGVDGLLRKLLCQAHETTPEAQRLQPLHRRDQFPPQTLRMDRRSQSRARGSQARAASIRVAPLALGTCCCTIDTFRSTLASPAARLRVFAI
jgi:hypothetical protein